MAKKKPTTEDAVKDCLESYYFQWGSRANKSIIRKVEKLLRKLDGDKIKDNTDYKHTCMGCGENDFGTIVARVSGHYKTQTFRYCKKCGTMKMAKGYYNPHTKKYQDTVVPKKEDWE